MSNGTWNAERRKLLQAASGLALGQVALASTAGAATTTPAGKVGDFNFLAGEWRIAHRRPKKSGNGEWDLFNGEATCWTVLGGVGSIEELRIPARDFIGMGIRLLDLEKRLWFDYWVAGKSGALAPPGMTGGFDNGVGTFTVDDVDGDQPLKVRGVWDLITPASCRWHQAVSRDGASARVCARECRHVSGPENCPQGAQSGRWDCRHRGRFCAVKARQPDRDFTRGRAARLRRVG